MSYSYNYIDNHIVANIDGKQCLIDTGSPFSLGDGSIDIDGETHKFIGKSFMGAGLESIAEHLNTHLDALIGGDVLSKHEGLFIWTEKGEIHFNSMMGSGAVQLELFSNIPMISMNIRSQMVKAYIDTGAKQSYVDSSIAEGLPYDGEITDFYPTQGSFSAPIVSIGYIEPDSCNEAVLKFAILPQSLSGLLSMTGCKVILGVDWLRNEKAHFQIDYYKKTFSNS